MYRLPNAAAHARHPARLLLLGPMQAARGDQQGHDAFYALRYVGLWHEAHGDAAAAEAAITQVGGGGCKGVRCAQPCLVPSHWHAKYCLPACSLAMRALHPLAAAAAGVPDRLRAGQRRLHGGAGARALLAARVAGMKGAQM